jgi:hypothetical protein
MGVTTMQNITGFSGLTMSFTRVLSLGRRIWGNDQSLDLSRAAEDLQDLTDAHRALDSIAAQVAVAAQDLDRVGGLGARPCPR